MKPIKKIKRERPEAVIQKRIIKELRFREWFVKPTHGSAYQSGFPDLYACHIKYGPRWIEVKLPELKGSKLTPAQQLVFPQMTAHGSGIWILTSATPGELHKLFKPPNWALIWNLYKRS